MACKNYSIRRDLPVGNKSEDLIEDQMLHAFTTVFFQVRSKKTKERFYRTFGPLLKLPLDPSVALFLIFGGIFLAYIPCPRVLDTLIQGRCSTKK